jgi:hypothetical protein
MDRDRYFELFMGTQATEGSLEYGLNVKCVFDPVTEITANE